MAQEIELKFIVQPSAVDGLRAWLMTLESTHSPASELVNIYFETPDNQLRRHNMGLRIRGASGRYEMTMKTAGSTTGALHQRPEYNVPLTAPALDLPAFPIEMWPEDLDVAQLGLQLEPRFRTDFSREKWVVTHGDSRIEIALDQGAIVADALSEPLCELELELIAGQLADLLALTHQVAARPGLRAGLLSKAARGYHLAQGNPARQAGSLAPLALAPRSTVEQGLSAALNLALNHWAWHEELWLRGNQKAQAGIFDALALVRHSLILFGGIVPRKASAHLRDFVSQVEVSLASSESPETWVYAPLTGQTHQALIEWVLLRGWRPFLDTKEITKIEGSFKRFADTHLSRLASELRAAFEKSHDECLEDQLPRLARALDGAHILAGCFPESDSIAWLTAWRELKHALRSRQQWQIEASRREALNQAPFWAHSGKR